ncbi:MAG TPA: 16S rRNA (uracil(1498)-N(3))-methyltransferase [Peptococcaceae bacterium]|nr:16S rRNA (uracil(1498)-N(3))-methyltransferase [Peptococcaceae bacterium]
MERFYVPAWELDHHEARICGEAFKHLSKVLRLQPGDEVEIFDGAGKGFKGQIREITQNEAYVALTAAVAQRRESPLRTCLVQGIPKGEKMEWVVQKATELGVSELIPLEMSRSIVKFDNDKKRKERQERWQKVAAEAARQCGRLIIPKIHMPQSLKTFLVRLGDEDLLLIPWEEGGAALSDFFEAHEAQRASITEAVSKESTQSRGCLYLMIGPEGGMDASEVEQAKARGGVNVTLGPRILRTETAGLMLLSVIQYQWGDTGR